jgi:hypothetical protein
MEKCDEGPIIEVVTHGGARIGDDVMNKGMHIEQWVRK